MIRYTDSLGSLNEVVPELEKFMEAMNSKIAVIYDMVATLQDKRNPPPLQRYQLILNSKYRCAKYESYKASIYIYIYMRLHEYMDLYG